MVHEVLEGTLGDSDGEMFCKTDYCSGVTARQLVRPPRPVTPHSPKRDRGVCSH